MNTQYATTIVNHPLLEISDKEDIFSFGYILAIIGSAGYNYGKDALDRDSEDLYVKHRQSKTFIPSYKSLGIQVKCTYYHKPDTTKGYIPYPLKRKNYEDLSTTLQPHILVVVLVPDEMKGCTQFGSDHLILRNRAYWMSLRGYPPISDDSQKTIMVNVPLNQEFTVEELHNLMSMISQGERP